MHRLVTLTGPGGCGKTRPTTVVAGGLHGRATPLAWVSLAPLEDAALVVPTIGAALGLREQPGPSGVDAIITGLLTIRTMASQGGEIYRRAITLVGRIAPKETVKLMKDLLDQYERVSHISRSQLEFLMGVSEFYRARTDTKLTIAAERLAVIAAITLPVTALSSIVGE